MDFSYLLKDPVATYAAALSSVTALAGGSVAFYKWLTSGPKAWVGVINPKEVAVFDHRTIEIIISNVRTEPFVVREVVLSFHKKKRNAPHHSVRYNHAANWDPSEEEVPDPSGKPNRYIKVAKVLKPGDELHKHMALTDSYDPSTDWICAEVFLRQKRASTKGWAAPIPNAKNSDT